MALLSARRLSLIIGVSMKVDVSVNGQQIPYHMKIGDAGEAFFVFETEGEVPEDLITSPLLEATKTEDEEAGEQVSSGRFGAKNDSPGDGRDNESLEVRACMISLRVR